MAAASHGSMVAPRRAEGVRCPQRAARQHAWSRRPVGATWHDGCHVSRAPRVAHPWRGSVDEPTTGLAGARLLGWLGATAVRRDAARRAAPARSAGTGLDRAGPARRRAAAAARARRAARRRRAHHAAQPPGHVRAVRPGHGRRSRAVDPAAAARAAAGAAEPRPHGRADRPSRRGRPGELRSDRRGGAGRGAVPRPVGAQRHPHPRGQRRGDRTSSDGRSGVAAGRLARRAAAAPAEPGDVPDQPRGAGRGRGAGGRPVRPGRPSRRRRHGARAAGAGSAVRVLHGAARVRGTGDVARGAHRARCAAPVVAARHRLVVAGRSACCC